jgi:hypothetical protein
MGGVALSESFCRVYGPKGPVVDLRTYSLSGGRVVKM